MPSRLLNASSETPAGPSENPVFDPGSYRDRTGRVLQWNNRIFRLFDAAGSAAWQQLQSSRFLADSISRGLLIPTFPALDFPWQQINGNHRWTTAIEHERIPFISYPYEWSWSMLRDAAILHLDLLLRGIDESFLTKDGSSYNIQWKGTKPLFIDVGSISLWKSGQPWVGYRQFCQTFLFPLMLASQKGIPFQPWLRGSLDGIDVGQIVRAYGWTDILKPGVLIDVWLHHKLQAGSQQTTVSEKNTTAGLTQQVIKNNLLRLKKIIHRLPPPPVESRWTGYAANNTYSSTDHRQKQEFIESVARSRHWKLAWDLGCNTGEFSRILAANSDHVIAMDSDLPSIELLYRKLRDEETPNILPLCLNLADSSPSQGWRGLERQSLTRRGKPELTIALALIHHLVIGANLPMTEVIEWFASLQGELVIEFVGRDDPMVKSLLKNKEDHYFDYDQAFFESCLGNHFAILRRCEVNSGHRTLYHCRPKSHETD